MIQRRTFLKGASAAIIAATFSRRLLASSSAESPNLADQINNTLNAVQSWNVGMYGSLANIGLIMSNSAGQDYDSWIAANARGNNWLGVFQVKNFAQHSGYDSPTIESALRSALENMPMLDHYLPATTVDSDGTEWFYPFYRYSLYGYQFSSERNLRTDRWNSEGACQYLANVYDSFGRSFYGLNDNFDSGSNYAMSEPYGTRWLDVGKVMGSFLAFYDLGISVALEYALKCWNELNASFWHSNHYTYATGEFGYEFSAMDVIPNVLRLKKLVPNLPNADRITTDLVSRYLAGRGSGQWSGSTPNIAVVEHLTDDS